MNNRQTLSLTYFLSQALFIGFGYSLLLKIALNDTWICAIMGTILGCLIIYFSEKEKKQKNIIFLIYNIFIFIQIMFIFETFASSFFLLNSPAYYILLPLPFIIYLICNKGFKTIAKISEILCPISIALFILSFLGLINNFQIDNLKPFLINEPLSIIKGSIYYAIYSTAPIILLINKKKEKLISQYLISSIITIILTVFIIAILGVNLIELYRYPEYMILKKIKLFNFIENVENIISIAWLFSLFITLSVAGNNIKEHLNNNKLFIISLIIMYLLSIYSCTYYKEELVIYHLLPIILGIFMLIILIKKKK